MPQTPIENNSRMSLRISPEDKALLMRAGAIEGMSLSGFVIRSSVNAARDVVERTQRIVLSERDSLRVLEILENPPKPNDKLKHAAEALPELA